MTFFLTNLSIPTLFNLSTSLPEQDALNEAIDAGSVTDRVLRIEQFLEENVRMSDLLLYFLRKADKETQCAVIELYIRK